MTLAFMASVLALVSKGVFEKAHRDAAVGQVLAYAAYHSTNAGLRPLGEGGDLYLVTVRPGDALWLVAVLRAPRAGKAGWTAMTNIAPVCLMTQAIKKLRFTTGSGLRAAPGKLGMSLQTPRTLTDGDVAVLESLSRAAPAAKTRTLAKAAPPAKPARTTRAGALDPWATKLRDYLALPSGLAEAPLSGTWRGVVAAAGPERKHTPLKESLLWKTNAAIYALMSGALIWAAERLRNATDVRPLEELAVALFLFQQEPRYLRKQAKITPIDEITRQARPIATARELVSTAPWQTSLHLTPPAQMRAAGFRGTPYKTPR